MLSRFSPRVQRIIILTALSLIPLIYAGLLVWSVKDPTGDLSTMGAAIVNEDSPTTDSDGERLALGQDLTDELLDSDDSFTWATMDADEATTALEGGEVRAVLTIPEDFSSAAASLGDEDPMAATASRLTIQTDDASNIVIGNIGSKVGEAVRASVAQQVSEEFLAQVTVGFNEIGDNLAEAADGAHDLSDGTGSAKDGADDLVVGLDTLSDGAYDLSDGASQLAAGASTASTGASQLADGLGELDEQTSSLPDAARTLDDGANKLVDGAKDLRDGAGDLSDGVGTAASGADDLATGADDALSGAQELEQGAGDLADSTGPLADGAAKVAAGGDTLLENWDVLSDDQKRAAVESMTTGAGDVSDGASALDDGAQSLADGASALTGTAPENGTPTGLNALAVGADDLASGLEDARDGANDLADGGDVLHEGAEALTDGTGRLVDAADQLSEATGSAATASADLSDGVSALSRGADDLSEGTDRLASGTGDAASGAGDLRSGLGDLDDGAGELATGLDDGRDEVPTYTDEEGDHLSSTAADPVELNEERLHEVPGYGWGLAPYFASLALWVGAIGYFLMMPALNVRAIIESRSRVRAIAVSLLPAVLMSLVQSALMVTVVRFWVDIDMSSTAGMYGLSFIVSLCFFLLNQLLIAGFGPPGRFLALILMVVQLSAAGGTYPIETAPKFMQAMHAWLPITHSVDGMRSLIAGGPFDTAGVLLPLAGWTLVALAGLVAVVLVTWRKVHATRPRSRGAHDARSGAGEERADSTASADSAASTEPAAITEHVETVAVESRE